MSDSTNRKELKLMKFKRVLRLQVYGIEHQTLSIKNMRVNLREDITAGKFSELLLQIEDGRYLESDGKIILSTDLVAVISFS